MATRQAGCLGCLGDARGRLLLEHLALDGVYRSQFETGTSNGGLTARPGGDRWWWESRLSGGAYDTAPAHRRPKYGSLNHRRRAHVHGPLSWTRDLEAVVLDPSYRDTAVAAAAEQLPFPVESHHGFRVHVDELAQHAHYRGAHIIDVARHVAAEHGHDGWLDPRVIGDADRAGRWHRQELKRVWHCTARFGHATP